MRLLKNTERLAVNAPTGFGKTVLTLCGIGYRLIQGDRQLYVFAKTKAQLRSVFLRNFKRIYNRPPYNQLTIVPLIARSDLCYQPQHYSCDSCHLRTQAKYLSQTHLNELLHALTIANCPKTLPGFRDFLAPFGCPYHLVKRMVPRAQIVLLTQGYLEHLFLREKLDRLLFEAEKFGFNWTHREVVIDEAHNFGPTIEATVTREQLLHACEIAPLPLVRALSRILEQPLGMVQRPKEALPETVVQLDNFLGQRRSRAFLPVKEREVLRTIRSFIQRRSPYWVLNEQGLLQLNPYPSTIFDFLLPRFDRVILLSGTFFGLSLYNRFYGLSNGGRSFQLHQVPLTAERRRQLFFGALYRRGISSRLIDRTPEFAVWCAELIHQMALLAHDHTFVYVPSYEFLESLFPLLQERLAGQLPLFREPAQGRISFMADLIQGSPSVVLAVYGGKFSEGVELRHPSSGRSRIRLIILVGLPFPVPSPEHLLLTQLYQRRWNPLFAKWALRERVLYTKVLQCMGRAIRSGHDRGVVILLDDRATNLLLFRFFGLRVFTSQQDMINSLIMALVRSRN